MAFTRFTIQQTAATDGIGRMGLYCPLPKLQLGGYQHFTEQMTIICAVIILSLFN